MNRERRKLLQKIVNSVDEALSLLANPAADSLEAKIADLKTQIEPIQSDEQEAFDNLPESIQESDRGTAAQDFIEKLDEAMCLFDEIEDALTTISDTLGSLRDALEEAAQ